MLWCHNFVAIIGASVELFTDERKILMGLLLQEREMKTAFSAYPELLCLNATYKLLELGLPVYLMLSEDANGQSEVFTVCLLAEEDAESVTWMVDAFKKNNEDGHKIRIIMADTDIEEREVLKQCIPNASVLICLFHTLQTFRREVSCEKMRISSSQRNTCLQFLQKLCYAYSETEYDELYKPVLLKQF